MTTMWGAPLHKRWRGQRLRDPLQAKFLTRDSLRWVIANKAYTPWYLVRYWRLLKFKLANPHIVTRGMLFLGKNVEIHCTPELARMEIGRWVHIGDGNSLRAHEGSLRLGDKVVFGKDNVVNAYIDIEFGDSALMADWCYVCDFDHRMEDITYPIKDQGIVKSPVRIGPDTWIAAKVTILRDTIVGRGCVLGAHAVVKGVIPDYSIAVGARPRWSRTGRWPGTPRVPSVRSWPRRWPISNARRRPLTHRSECEQGEHPGRPCCVLRVRREGGYGTLPPRGTFSLIGDLLGTHSLYVFAIAQFEYRVGAQIRHPGRILRRPAD